MRLDKYLSENQAGTRSQVKKLIAAGRVSVNDTIIKDTGYKVDEKNDNICLDGKSFFYEENRTYLFYKPANCVTANKDDIHKTVFDYFPNNLRKDLNAAGRLDLDTEGLLILTTDGQLLHHLISPSHQIDKTYIATLDKAVPPEAVNLFSEGINIGDEKDTLPAKLTILSDKEPYRAQLTICEGRFHQVKRMFAAVGCTVCHLIRVSEGFLTLDGLQPGEYRRLTEEEINRL